MVGARGFEHPTPLLPKHGRSLLKLVLIILTVTLVTCCVAKCQEVPIILAQIWPSDYGGLKIPIELARQFLNDMEASLF